MSLWLFEGPLLFGRSRCDSVRSRLAIIELKLWNKATWQSLWYRRRNMIFSLCVIALSDHQKVEISKSPLQNESLVMRNSSQKVHGMNGNRTRRSFRAALTAHVMANFEFTIPLLTSCSSFCQQQCLLVIVDRPALSEPQRERLYRSRWISQNDTTATVYLTHLDTHEQ